MFQVCSKSIEGCWF